MSERLKFNFDRTERGPRLALRIPRELVQRAVKLDPHITEELQTAARRRHIALTVTQQEEAANMAINTRALGRIKNVGTKQKALLRVIKLIDVFACQTPNPEEVDKDLLLRSFEPISGNGRFSLTATVRVPDDISPDTLQTVARAQMVSAMDDLLVVGSPSPRVSAYQQEAYASVDTSEEIVLSLSACSRLEARGQKPQEGANSVDFVGSNVYTFLEPLPYLVGVAALTKASELIANPNTPLLG